MTQPLFTTAPQEIVDLVSELVAENHPQLADVRIGLLMRDTAPKANNRLALGKTRLVTREQQALIPFDYVIWFAEDIWDEMTDFQRRALVEHELCHCKVFMSKRGPKMKIRNHDFEEFDYIIIRYGFWRPNGEHTEEAVNQRLGYQQPGLFGDRPRSQVGAVQPHQMPGVAELEAEPVDIDEVDDSGDEFEKLFDQGAYDAEDEDADGNTNGDSA